MNRPEESKGCEKETNLKPFVVVRGILSRRKSCSWNEKSTIGNSVIETQIYIYCGIRKSTINDP